MQNILEEIFNHKLLEVRDCKKQLSVQEICKQINCQNHNIPNFFEALQNKKQQGKIGLIAEIKKASPSQGLIIKDFDHLEIAKIYKESGAACLSILTDKKYFQGSPKYLQEVASQTDLPILRKDFMVDTYQIYEAKMLGASCILLIVAMLNDKKLSELEQCAIDSGLSVLIEVHNEAELQRAAKLKSKLIGINNRNLKTMKVDLKNTLSLIDQIPDGYLIISESGIKTKSDIQTLGKVGISTFLIGEHFMRQENISLAVKDILE